ncbi:MAG TPA: hypothetical protein VLE73_01230 [Candidatus Saccharimonadales bacterium]|nr:hypothetical protein [Candidatus Saccharimonadales bacterium]
MKTKTINKHRKPFHLHLEHFFRTQYCLLFVLGLLMVAILKSDGKVMSVMREAYAQGYGIVGQYMREETTRVATTIDVGIRAAHHSGY